jgi:hypothetical protein
LEDDELTEIRYFIYLGVALGMTFKERVESWMGRLIELGRKGKERTVGKGKEVVDKGKEKVEKMRAAKEESMRRETAMANNETLIHVLAPPVEETPMMVLKGDWWCRYV